MTMKNSKKYLASAVFGMTLLATGVVFTSQAALAEEYAVIVNAENTYSAPKDEAQRTVRRIL